jgi:hypothetical protein
MTDKIGKRRAKWYWALVASMSACATMDQAQLGGTPQASVLSPALNTNDEVCFPGIARLGTTDKWIQIGGYDHLGAAVTRSVIFDATASSSMPDNRYLALSAALPSALGELSIKLVEHTGTAPNDTWVFMMGGGRTVRDGAAQPDTYVLTLSGANYTTATWDTVNVANGGHELRTAAVLGHDEIKQCGSSSTKQIAAGGMLNGGMDDLTNITATDAIQVFTYVSANKQTSHWDYLVDANGHQVTLSDLRGYKETFGVSNNDIRVFGGANQNTKRALHTVDKILLSDQCVANGNLGTPSMSGIVKVIPINNMPGARARLDSIVKDFTISNTTYKFAMGGGNDDTDNAPLHGFVAPTAVFYYDPVGDAYNSTTASLATGRLFPLFADDSGQVQLVAGVTPTTGSATHLINTTVTDVDKLSTANGTRSAGAALTQDRVGSLVTHVVSSTGKGYAVNGCVYLNGTCSTPAGVKNAESF